MKTSLKIVHHNVQFWQTKKQSLYHIYNQIDPDIILINSHCLINNERLSIYNYNTFQFNKQNELHAGTAIAIRKSLTFRLIDDFHSDMIAITIDTTLGPITIGTDYIPPRRQYINYIDYHSLFNRNEPTYFIGDINGHHTTLGDTHTNKIGKQITSLIARNKIQHLGPTFPTTLTHNGSGKPDKILANYNIVHNTHISPGPITPSDHIPIIFKISALPILIPITPRRQFHRADWDAYRYHLQNTPVPTDPAPTLEDIDKHLETWEKNITDISQQTIPKIHHRTIPSVNPTHEIKQIQLSYNRLLNNISTYGPSIHKHRSLLQLRYQLHQQYRNINNNNWNDLIQKLDSTDDPKQFWRSIRKMMGNNTKQQTPYLRDQHNNKLHTPQEKEPIFRKHWEKIFTDEDNENFDYENIEYVKDQLGNRVYTPYDTGNMNRLHGTDFPPISTREFDSTLNTFKHKAPGPSGITTLQLKNLPQNIKQYLLYIYNNAISAGYFPGSLKHAHMIFIPKAGSQHSVKNYRPISLLEIHGKLLGKILNNRLIHHLNNNHIMNSRQHGFRTSRGTHTALATLYGTISQDIYNKHKIDIVLRDVSKAFDKVWPTGLQYKITNLNIHTCFTRILCDFLEDRTALVRIGRHIGTPIPLHTGVAQGSCLSPTLYSYYTHDIPEPIPNTDYICYADDITQIISGRFTYKYTAQQTQHAILQLNNYEAKWKIQTHSDKFKIIPIRRHITETIEIDGEELHKYETQGTVLGLDISTHGVTQQIKKRKAMALGQLDKLYRFKGLSSNIKLKFTTPLSDPHYCIQSFHYTHNQDHNFSNYKEYKTKQ